MPPEPPAPSTLNLAARRVLDGYPHPYRPHRLCDLGSGGGFSGARLWRVEAAAGLFCLRAMPAAHVNTVRLSGLHDLLLHVRDCGIEQTPVPVCDSEGRTWIRCNHAIWQLEPWLPGTADFHAKPTLRRLQNALSLLARWHRAAATFEPEPDERQWFGCRPAAPSPGISSRLHRISKWDDARCDRVRESLRPCAWPAFDEPGARLLALFRQASGSVAAELQLGSQVMIPVQPCLLDIWHDHVLFTGDEVTGLIDAHSCRADCVATDLARLLGSLVGDDRAGWDAGLAAYEQIRPLSLAERGLLELFDRSAVLLNGLTWLEWRCLEGRRFEQPEIVVERLQTIVVRLERLVRNLP